MGIAVGIKSSILVFAISLPAIERGLGVGRSELGLQCLTLSDNDDGDNYGVVRTDEHGNLAFPHRTKKHKAAWFPGDMRNPRANLL